MEPLAHDPLRTPLLLLAALAGTAAVMLAFYGWLQYGSAMLLTLGETGLSICL